MGQNNTTELGSAIDLVGRAPWTELVPLMQALSGRLYAERQENPRGYTPKPIFELCLGMGGMFVSAQIVNEVVGPNGEHLGFALKKRDESDSGDAWRGMFHSTCTSGLIKDTPGTMLDRDTVEAFGFHPEDDTIEFLGVTIHDEPERCGACLTVMHRRKVTMGMFSTFNGTWEIFKDVNDPRIIDHNRYLLQWVLDRGRPKFADVRGGWTPSWSM